MDVSLCTGADAEGIIMLTMTEDCDTDDKGDLGE
jgi:hypothetical protein